MERNARMHADMQTLLEKAMPGDETLEMATAQVDLASVFVEQEKYDEAIRLCKKSLATHEKLLPEQSQTAKTMISLGVAQLQKMRVERGRFLDDDDVYQEVLDMCNEIPCGHHGMV